MVGDQAQGLFRLQVPKTSSTTKSLRLVEDPFRVAERRRHGGVAPSGSGRYFSLVAEDTSSLTLAVLKEIRDEARKTNERLDQTNERLDRLERRQTETEVKLATELVAVSTAVREVGDLLRANVTVRAKVDEHEARIAALERKVG